MRKVMVTVSVVDPSRAGGSTRQPFRLDDADVERRGGQIAEAQFDMILSDVQPGGWQPTRLSPR